MGLYLLGGDGALLMLAMLLLSQQGLSRVLFVLLLLLLLMFRELRRAYPRVQHCLCHIRQLSSMRMRLRGASVE